MSLNVRGINDKVKRMKIFRWLRNKKIDIAFLQETFSTKESEKQWTSDWDGEILFSHGTAHGKGVMILCSPKADIYFKDILTDKDGRYIITNCSLNGTDISLINIYSPNKVSEQVTFFSKIQALIQQQADGTIIMGGDCNLSLTELDKIGGRPIAFKDGAIKGLKSILNTFNLSDVWRYKNPNNRQYTWQNNNIKCRLDYWFIPCNMLQHSECNIKVAPVPDHMAVSLSITSSNYKKRGPGFWRFNNSKFYERHTR